MLLYMILPASILDLVTSWALNELTAYKNLMLRPLVDEEAQFKVWAQKFNDTEKEWVNRYKYSFKNDISAIVFEYQS